MKLHTLLFCFLLLISCSAQAAQEDISGLKEKISKIISTKNATFGIGIYDFKNKEYLYINENKIFPLMSVVKFPQAIAILRQVDQGKLDYDMKIHFIKDDLRQDTYSPITLENRGDNFYISLSEALSYTISKSANNVCDKLFKILGSVEVAENYILNLGLKSISIGTNYANMEVNTIYANQSSPKDMLELLRMFHDSTLLSKKSYEMLWQKMIETDTGSDRIKGLLPERTVVGHKTGSSKTNKDGITAACNDVGIVKLPNGRSYAIVVFIHNSKEEGIINAKTIAEISKTTYDYLNN